jgi:hypothetical protein
VDLLATGDADPAAGVARRRRRRHQAFPQASGGCRKSEGGVLNPERAASWAWTQVNPAGHNGRFEGGAEAQGLSLDFGPTGQLRCAH